jgi:hypothetical protein
MTRKDRTRVDKYLRQARERAIGAATAPRPSSHRPRIGLKP